MVARTLDAAAYAVRRDQFLDVTQRLLETKGYELMSVQDVLDQLGTSKGAFYHYFGSKQALLEAVAHRMADAVAAQLAPLAEDPEPHALDKLGRFFDALARWKAQRRQLLVALLRIWYSDGNALLREKLRAGIADRIAPLLGKIIRDGVREGAFTAPYPDQLGRVVVSLIQDLNDRLAELFLAAAPGPAELPLLESTVAAYTRALERVLGLPTGSVVLVEMDTLRRWFDATDNRNGAS